MRLDPSGWVELSNIGTDASGYAFGAATSINASGAIAGACEAYDANHAQKGLTAVRWSASGAVTALDKLGDNPSSSNEARAYSINSTGTTVGFSSKYGGMFDPLGTRAVRWDAGGTAATELGNLGTDIINSTQVYAYAINDVGTIVGYGNKYDASHQAKGNRAVRWDAGGTAATELGTLGTDASGTSNCSAFALNAGGTAIGYASKYDAAGNWSGTRAVCWPSSGTAARQLDDLGTNTSGFTQGQAYAINSAGTMVGLCNTYSASGTSTGGRAVRWDASGAVAELGNLGMSASGITSSSATGVNSVGVAVGSAVWYDASGVSLGSRAVYWAADGAPVDLNSLIDPASGWTLLSAFSITDTGYIVGGGKYDPDGPSGQAAYDRLFVIQVPALTVPEPASLALLAIAGIGLVRRRRQELSELAQPAVGSSRKA